MREYELWGFRLEIDGDATKQWYDGAEEWGCECGHCRNFLVLARNRRLPAPVLEILDMLCIPPEKATYVCQMVEKEDGQLYEFSYRITGTILSGKTDKTVPQSWGEGICRHEIYPYGAPGFPQPHFDLEFWITLPWVLDEKETG